MRYDDYYPPYVPVAERRAKAEKKLQQLRKKHPYIKPVIIAGKSLATTWWGKSWNSNLERYADYRNRIDRGRSYVRHRAVLDLQLTSGNITALVQGREVQPYRVAITVDTLRANHWSTIRTACAGRVDSLSELLGGAFPQALQQQLLGQFGGLTFFPQPNDGFWTVAGVTYRDAIVIYRVLMSDAQEARQFLSALKERLKEELQQEDILIVERTVETL